MEYKIPKEIFDEKIATLKEPHNYYDQDPEISIHEILQLLMVQTEISVAKLYTSLKWLLKILYQSSKNQCLEHYIKYREKEEVIVIPVDSSGFEEEGEQETLDKNTLRDLLKYALLIPTIDYYKDIELFHEKYQEILDIVEGYYEMCSFLTEKKLMKMFAEYEYSAEDL